MPPPVFRFAPSPNGYLHLGHAFSAMLNSDLARQSGGRFLLRIEDIDPARCRGEFEHAIDDDLTWLGLSWEKPVRRQSEHFTGYGAALEKLTALGLVYPAFESRAEIAGLIRLKEADTPWPRDPDGAPLYPARARARRAGTALTIGRALRAAARYGGGLRARWPIELDRARGGPERRIRDGHRKSCRL